MASPTTSTSSVLLLVLVATTALANLTVAARLVDAAALTSTAKHAMASSAGGAADGAELDGMIECMIGCFTQVMSCAFGCMGKGPDLPLCVISCNQKSIVCMIRCGLVPSPPTPPAPTPKPPALKPSPPPMSSPPPMPSPPGPPYAGHNTETSA